MPQVGQDQPNFKLLFEFAPMACLVLDPDFKIVSVSEKYLHATMTERKNIIGKGIFEIFPDNPNEALATGTLNLESSLRRVVNNKMADALPIQRYDIRLPVSQGGAFEERYWTAVNSPIFDEKGEVIYIIHKVEDVTAYMRLKQEGADEIILGSKEFQLYKEKMEVEIFERTRERKRAQDRLEAAQIELNMLNNLLQGIIEGTADIIAAYDTRFNLMYSNNAFQKEYYKAYNKIIHVGENLIESLNELPQDQANVRHAFEKGLQDGCYKKIEEFGNEDFQRNYYETNYYALINSKGEKIGIFHIAQNITERIKAEKKIKENEESLRQLNKELEAFSYSVSHDLRAPLRSINGFSQILQEKYEHNLPSEARRYLKLVRDSAKEMGNLVDDLLAFSRLGRQPLKTQEISMQRLIKSVCDKLLSEQANKEINITIAPDMPVAQADQSLLTQVLINFISNAIKFTRQTNTPCIEIGFYKENGETVYFIKDNGVGFDMRYAGKLFGVFQRLHKSEEFEGTGVGLAIIERVIHRHNGRVWANAEVGKGATFFFTLGAQSGRE